MNDTTPPLSPSLLRRLTQPQSLRWSVLLLACLMLLARVDAQVIEPAAAQKKQAPAAISRMAQHATSKAWQAHLQALAKQQDDASLRQAWLAQQVGHAMHDQKLTLAQDAKWVHFIAPPLSSLMRLPDQFPVDGQAGAPLRIVLAQDEYEPGSFLLYSFDDFDRVTLTAADLKSDASETLPLSQLDLTVVKVWYQNGNGWYSYFGDVGLHLVPELLLHDEKLIEVDTQSPANYARVAADEKVWISSPREIDPWFDPHAHPGFEDAAVLQPVSLEAGLFKQFFLTVHATKDTKPGIYRGGIRIVADGGASQVLPVEVRVLPFVLPSPKTNFDLEKDFLVRLMSAWPRRFIDGKSQPLSADAPAFLPMLRNMARHNLHHIGPFEGGSTPPADAQKQIDLAREAGLPLKPVIAGNIPWLSSHDGTPINFDELMTVRRSARNWATFYRKTLGHTDAYLSFGDEQAAPWVMKARPLWRVIQEEGLKTFLAGHEHIFTKAGYILDMHAMAGQPDDAHQAAWWRDMGHGYSSFYANQHNGSENPSFVRKQHGMMTYLANFSMIHNYEFAYGPWNDRAYDLYKPMVLAYPTHNGFVDTLAWEGFREGIDDIRYATKLRMLATQAIDSGELDLIYLGRETRLWLGQLNVRSANMHTLRLEMISRILRLQAMLQNQS